MCGIAGVYNLGFDFAESHLQAMLQAIQHRGPDFQKIVSDRQMWMGHARLSIIDLSEHAHQPFQDTSGRYTIVFNGEIYNFLEIRATLEKFGIPFKTKSDTEVVVESIKFWGIDTALKQFSGMFAFALWDSKDEKLFLARDRLGEKPLVYYASKNGFAFASDGNAILKVPFFTPRIQLSALKVYLELNYVPTEYHMLEGIQKLPPAHYCVVQQGKVIQQKCYWDLKEYFQQKTKASFEESADILIQLLAKSLSIQLRSDVPVGAFLSGGIDSSTLATLMKKVLNTNAKTFSLGFRQHSFDESIVAREYAHSMGFEHYESKVEQEDLNHLEKIFAFFDEPFADTSLIATYKLSQLAADKVKVAISGDGGDELFGGYVTYQADLFNALFPTSVASPFLHTLAGFFPTSFAKVGVGFKIEQFSRGMHLENWHAHSSWRNIFWGAEIENLLLPDIFSEVKHINHYQNFYRFSEEVKDLPILDQAMYLDCKTWLVDNVLTKLDRCTMAHSLEARAPFLDKDLVALACSLPPEWRTTFFQTKKILKHALQNILPAKILNRKKQGFNAPVAYWLQDEIKDLTHDFLFSQKMLGYFSKQSLTNLWADHQQGRKDQSLKLFSLLAFSTWLHRVF